MTKRDEQTTDEEKLFSIAQNISNIPNIHADLVNEEKERLSLLIRTYFRNRLERNNGIVTTDMLKIADKLYISGMTIILADSLNMTQGELRIKLGRKKQVQCANCGIWFEVIEPRRIDGYTPSNEKLCQDCLKKERIHWRETYEQSQWELAKEVRLLSRIAISRDPFEIEEFRNKLRHYAQHWMLKGYVQMTWAYAYQTGGGCMLCGRTPFRLFVDLKTPIDEHTQDYWQKIVDAQYRAGENPYPPIIKTAQALFQFRPETYFLCFPHFPIGKMPVLLLCAKCSEFVRSTHTDALHEEFGENM